MLTNPSCIQHRILCTRPRDVSVRVGVCVRTLYTA